MKFIPIHTITVIVMLYGFYFREEKLKRGGRRKKKRHRKNDRNGNISANMSKAERQLMHHTAHANRVTAKALNIHSFTCFVLNV